jgi:hypothetical protein
LLVVYTVGVRFRRLLCVGVRCELLCVGARCALLFRPFERDRPSRTADAAATPTASAGKRLLIFITFISSAVLHRSSRSALDSGTAGMHMSWILAIIVLRIAQ